MHTMLLLSLPLNKVLRRNCMARPATRRCWRRRRKQGAALGVLLARTRELNNLESALQPGFVQQHCQPA